MKLLKFLAITVVLTLITIPISIFSWNIWKDWYKILVYEWKKPS